PEIAVQTLGVRRAIDASGAQSQVAIGALHADNYRGAALSATRNWIQPPAEMARSYEIPVSVLLESEKNPNSRTMNGEPWHLLNHASVVARIQDGKGGGTGVGPTLTLTNRATKEVTQIP